MPAIPPKDALDDALHALLCGAGHNIRLLLKKPRLLCPEIADQIWSWLVDVFARNGSVMPVNEMLQLKQLAIGQRHQL